MAEPLYTSTARIEKVAGVHRRAALPPDGATIDMGVHGPIARHYQLEGGALPLPVDYIVAATGG